MKIDGSVGQGVDWCVSEVFGRGVFDEVYIDVGDEFGGVF